eukprot:12934444-Prorocentrum_lima.AAC.1
MPNWRSTFVRVTVVMAAVAAFAWSKSATSTGALKERVFSNNWPQPCLRDAHAAPPHRCRPGIPLALASLSP